MDQRTEDWYAAKAGKFSASEMSDLMAKKTTAAYNNLIAKKVAERLTGEFTQGFTSSAMQWGVDQEESARDTYFVRKLQPIEEVGFIEHPQLLGWAGASPDGMVADDGLVEIKCPNTATHIEYLRYKGDPKKIPSKYRYQMQWQLACTGRQWCDFVSYDPRMPDDLCMTIIRVQRDEKLIAQLYQEVEQAVQEVQTIINELREIQ